MSLLIGGLLVSVPGVTLDHVCASRLEVIGAVARAIRSEEIRPNSVQRGESDDGLSMSLTLDGSGVRRRRELTWGSEQNRGGE